MSSETGPPFGSLSSAQPTTLDHSPTASDRQLYPNSTEKGPASTSAAEPKATRSSNWKKYAVIGVVALIIVVLAVVLPVYFLVIKKNSSSSGGSSGGGGGGGSGSDGEGVVSQPGGVTSGTDGSVVFTETGNFTYVNKFGGRWSYDPANPYANGTFHLSPLCKEQQQYHTLSIAQCTLFFCTLHSSVPLRRVPLSRLIDLPWPLAFPSFG